MPELIVWMHAGSPWHRTAPVTWCEIYTRKLGTRRRCSERLNGWLDVEWNTLIYVDDICTMCPYFVYFIWKMFWNISHLSSTASRIHGWKLVLECYCNGSSSGFGMSWWSQSIQVSWTSAFQHPTRLTLNIRARICFLREILDVERIVGKYRFQTCRCNSGYTCQQGDKRWHQNSRVLPGLRLELKHYIFLSLTLWPLPQLGPANVFTFKQKTGLWRVDHREFQSFRILEGWKNWERGFKNMVEA